MDTDRIAYTRRLAWECIVMFLLSLILASEHAHAQTYIVQRNGVQQFTSANLQVSGTTYNFTDGTAPVNDPNALNNIVGQFAQHQCARYSTSTGQDFSQLWGRSDAAGQPITTTWPYAPSTTLMVPLPPNGRYYGGIVNSGLNPGILPHYLKGNGYAGSCVPAIQVPTWARVNVRVVPVGSTPAPTGLCSKMNVPFDNNPWVWLKFAGPANTSHCLGVIGGSYRYIVENATATAFNALMTWN